MRVENSDQCHHEYEGWVCPRPAVWNGLCKVHAAQELSAPINDGTGR